MNHIVKVNNRQFELQIEEITEEAVKAAIKHEIKILNHLLLSIDNRTAHIQVYERMIDTSIKRNKSLEPGAYEKPLEKVIIKHEDSEVDYVEFFISLAEDWTKSAPPEEDLLNMLTEASTQSKSAVDLIGDRIVGLIRKLETDDQYHLVKEAVRKHYEYFLRVRDKWLDLVGFKGPENCEIATSPDGVSEEFSHEDLSTGTEGQEFALERLKSALLKDGGDQHIIHKIQRLIGPDNLLTEDQLQELEHVCKTSRHSKMFYEDIYRKLSE